MGDILAIIGGLNLSPVNTVLLAVVIIFARGILKRIEKLEAQVDEHHVDLEVTKARLKMCEPVE